MNARTRELVSYGQACGFALDGVDGNGHHILRHPNGAVVRLASTPGEYRGDDNARAEMRRKSGVTPPRHNSDKYRKGVRSSGFSMSAALRERAARSDDDSPGQMHPSEVERLEKQLADVTARINRIRSYRKERLLPADPPQLRVLLDDWARLTQRLGY